MSGGVWIGVGGLEARLESRGGSIAFRAGERCWSVGQSGVGDNLGVGVTS